MTTVDNREILKYRGLVSPGEAIETAHQSAVRSAILNLSRLGTNIYAQYARTGSNSISEQVTTNPFMRLLQEDGSQTDVIYDFYFPYTPQNIQYSDLADEVSEIPRAGTLPLVTFKSHRLMKVSFEFLVAVPYDGMNLDVESSIAILRQFSTNSQRGIVFFNLDTMMTAAWPYRRGPSGRPLIFNIVEMSVTARQRNSLGKITQALVNITIVENQNPTMSIVKVPPFKKTVPKKKTPKPPSNKNTTIPAYSGNADTVAGNPVYTYLLGGQRRP